MKTTTKSAFHRGFTLIELMIVIVILGILMGTILPRLSGAQGRARDTARAADLNNIAQALELYYDDFSSYPGVLGTSECLDGTESFNSIFSTYFKGNVVPTPPQADAVDLDGTNTCAGGYLYLPLVARGSTDPQAYALVGNMETPAKDNYITGLGSSTALPGGTFTYDATTDISDVLPTVEVATPNDLVTADNDQPDGTDTLHVFPSGT